MSVTLADAVAALDARFPPSGAADWDRVGLVCGDPASPVQRVLFAVDPVADVVAEAVALGADLLVCHHPLLLRGVHSVAADSWKGALVHRLVRAGVALYTAHTSADTARPGVADALALAVGLVDAEPLVPAPGPATDAGCARTGLGRVGPLAVPTTLRGLAGRLAARLPATVGGVRWAGDDDAPVRTVAVLGGAGDGEFDAVRATGADAYVTADLRHHPASEARERALFEAATGRRPAPTPYLVDISHAAGEWLWLPAAAAALAADLTGTAGRPGTVSTHVSTLRTDPWTGHVRSSTAEGDP